MQRLTKAYLSLFGIKDDCSIGDAFYQGQYVARDLNKAKEYFEIAASRGEVRAFKRLRSLYAYTGNKAESLFYEGLVFEFNKEWKKACEKFELASQCNPKHRVAAIRLGIVLKKMEKAPLKKPLEAKELFNRAEIYEKNHCTNLAVRNFFAAAEMRFEEALGHLSWHPWHLKYLTSEQQFILAQLYKNIGNNLHAVLIYKNLADLGNEEALSAMMDLALSDADCAYEVAHQYTKNNNQASSYIYYLQAANKDHPKALQMIGNIKAAALDGNVWAQYHLGSIYQKQTTQESAEWLLMAIKQRFSPAIKFLKDVIFPAEIYRYIAKEFEAIDKSEALVYYSKALELGDAESGYIIGQYYLNEDSLTYDFQQALRDFVREIEKCPPKALDQMQQIAILGLEKHYLNQNKRPDNVFNALRNFIKAAELGHNAAEVKIKEILQFGAAEECYLASVCYQLENHVLKAVEMAISAASQGHCKANLYLQSTQFSSQVYIYLARTYMKGEKIEKNLSMAMDFYKKAVGSVSKDRGELYFEMAEIFFNNDELEDNVLQGYSYLTKAAKNDCADALSNLERLASDGDVVAQYFLGCDYYHHKPARFEAINWAMRAAEQGYQPAQSYLDNTVFNAELYLHIAKNYEQGVVVQCDITAAIYFYQKATNLCSKEAAFRLGSLYLSLNTQDDYLVKAFDAFFLAAQWGHPKAALSIECLAEDLGPDLQIMVGNFYQNSSHPNTTRALHWYQIASEGGNDEAREYIHSVNSKSMSPL